MAQRRELRYGNILIDIWASTQPSGTIFILYRAVQRLNGDGFIIHNILLLRIMSLRYSLVPRGNTGYLAGMGKNCPCQNTIFWKNILASPCLSGDILKLREMSKIINTNLNINLFKGIGENSFLWSKFNNWINPQPIFKLLNQFVEGSTTGWEWVVINLINNDLRYSLSSKVTWLYCSF